MNTWQILTIVIALVALFGCAAPKRSPTLFDTLIKQAEGGWPKAPNAARATLDTASRTGRQHAHAVVRHSKQLANVLGGLPIAQIEGRPIAGKPFRVGWTTRPTRPFVPAKTALFVTTKEPEDEFPIIGGAGAVLTVPPDIVLIPNDERVPFLTEHSGYVELNITFQPSQVGARFWLQLVVEDTRTAAGFVPGPVVAITVGDQ